MLRVRKGTCLIADRATVDEVARHVAREVLAPHDDGRWWPAEVLDQYRDRADGSWRVVVTYSTVPGMRYIRAMPAADFRL